MECGVCSRAPFGAADRQTQAASQTGGHAFCRLHGHSICEFFPKHSSPMLIFVDKPVLEHRSLGFCFPLFLMEKEATKSQPRLVDRGQEREGPDS